MHRKSVAAGFVPAILSFALATAAFASETVTYTYDAKGRLTKVERAGSVNNGVTAQYAHDKADNRLSVTVTGAPNGSGSGTAGTVADASFEDPPQNGGYAYDPASTGATFTGGAGVAGNGSAFGFAAAPDGVQAAFLQGNGAITLSVTGLTPGASYVVRFWTAQRPGYPANAISVALAGTGLGSYTPASTSWAQVTTGSFTAASSSGTLTFTGTNTTADVDTAIDAVSVVPAP